MIYSSGSAWLAQEVAFKHGGTDCIYGSRVNTTIYEYRNILIHENMNIFTYQYIHTNISKYIQGILDKCKIPGGSRPGTSTGPSMGTCAALGLGRAGCRLVLCIYFIHTVNILDTSEYMVSIFFGSGNSVFARECNVQTSI